MTENNHKCLAVIPARGGSQRIPGKNIRELRGKPLIAYTIDSALESGVFTRTVVSTDSEEIAGIARQYGADVPFMRSPELSDSNTHAPVVSADALERVDPRGTDFEFIAQLLPNCPLKNAQDILNSWEQFSNTGSERQVTVTRYGWFNPWWAMKLDKDFKIHPLDAANLKARSQDLPDLFCPTGVISWARVDVFRASNTFYGENTTAWEIPWYRALDIDTEDDWVYAELLIDLNEKLKHGP